MFGKLEKGRAECEICHNVYETNDGSTSSIWHHARTAHPHEIKARLVQEKKKQPTITEVFKSSTHYAPGSARKQQCDRALTAMISQDLRPLATCESPGFKEFCKILDKCYKIPSRTTVTETLLPKLYKEEKSKVKESLKNVHSISITTDLWTSVANHGYIGVTAHFLTLRRRSWPAAPWIVPESSLRMTQIILLRNCKRYSWSIILLIKSLPLLLIMHQP